MYDTLPPKRFNKRATGIGVMNPKAITNNKDINHDDCFNNHERCLT